MPAPKALAPDQIPDFGGLLRYLRRRARLTQRDLAIATGYSESQICRLEQNKRTADLSALMALFVPALDIDDQPELIGRLIELAALAREDDQTVTVVSTTRTETTVSEVIGAIEEPPPAPGLLVDRRLAERLVSRLEQDQRIVIYGLPGVGKTTLAAQVARAYPGPVFWLTLTAGVTASSESLLRQLALFLLTQGYEARALLPGIGEPALPLEQQVTLLGQGLSQLAERGAPALLGLDNAQLVSEDRSMVTTLQHLLATAPLRLLLTSRTALGWGEAVHVPLGGMEAAEARRLIAQFAADLEDDLAERLVERTDGNPMVLRLALGALPATPEARREFVDSLDTQSHIGEYLLQNVLDQLSPGAWALVSVLAVLRRPVDLQDELLLELIEAAEGQFSFSAAAAELIRCCLVNSLRAATLHPLIRDQVYGLLANDLPRRRRLHHLAAEWAELAEGDTVEAAYHFGRAGELVQASDVLDNQGARLISLGKSLSTAAVIAELLGLARRRRASPSIERRLRVVRGDVLLPTARGAEAEEDYAAAFALADTPQVRAYVGWRLMQVHVQRGRAAAAIELGERLVAELLPADTVLRAQVEVVAAVALQVLGRYAESLELGRRVLDTLEGGVWADAAPTLPIRAQAHSTLAVVSHIQGQTESAFDHWERALELQRQSGLRMAEYRSLANLGIAWFALGDFGRALGYFEQALAGLSATGEAYISARIHHNLGVLYQTRGEVQASREAFEAARRLKQQTGDRHGLLLSETMLAHALVLQGDEAAAWDLFESVSAAAAEIDDARVRASVVGLHAELLLLRDQPDPAAQQLRTTLALPEVAADLRLSVDLRHRLALALLMQGQTAEAAELLAEDLPSDLGSDYWCDRTAVRALLALARGDLAAARQLADQLSAEAERSGHLLYREPAARLRRAEQPRDLPRLWWCAAEPAPAG